MEIIIDRNPGLIEPVIPENIRSKNEGVVLTAPFPLRASFHGGPNRRSAGKVILFMRTAAIMDWLIILSASILAVVILSFIGKSEMMSTLKWLFAKAHANNAFVAVLILCGWTYFVVVRTYLGATLGEWACDLRLGKPSERMQKRYVLRNLLRTMIVICSGIVLIPLMSILCRRDLAGKLSGGLYIYSLK